ncbi:ZIP-like iron-zinc transporter [Lentinus tigrinus ALCF2SS1-6]|uniref:ZIP-like iron-zinc transporter n=1 Tax=Lentinus tigrinus ALCF2SS1-6 TaxID=1328759 RepID=A0A5C2SD32_9APHY|nr:ZIP-like iron-zinc transporter [Lentinus tigrinus ALCF2SS1-6]
MPSLTSCRRTLLLVAIAASLAVGTTIVAETEKAPLVVSDADVQGCAPIQQLSALKEELEAAQSPIMRTVFSWLFPFGPGWNSVLGTFYISSVPNFILAFIPAQINPNTLNTMTAFATGGLLSDVFLHLVPHSFMGEHQDGGVHFVMVEEKRNILIGLGIFIGFASFFIMEKTLRVLSSEDEQGHSHSHSHSNGSAEHSNGHSTAVSAPFADGLKSRGADKTEKHESNGNGVAEDAPKQTSKLSAYLNLFGDFVHNITDGLAMAASFYSSPLIGATTTLACFAHEIPHEIADYSILIRSGFTKKQAMQSQFLTAIGAFVRTFMGIGIRNLSAAAEAESEVTNFAAALRQTAAGILGTTVQLADLVIPFVAGGFMYIGAVAVLPTLLEESKSGKQALREFAAMFFGVACMFLVAWNE